MADDEWDDWDDDETSGSSALDDNADVRKQEAIEGIVKRLRDFQMNACDESLYSTINKELLANRGKTFADFIAYYSNKSQQHESQTLIDISRNSYSVSVNNEPTLTNTNEIQALHNLHHTNPLPPGSPHRLLWALSNQSIFSEIIAVLQRLHLSSGLSLGVVSTHTTFTLHFNDAAPCTLCTTSHLMFSCSKLTETGDLAKVPLASISAAIDVSLPATASPTQPSGTISQRFHTPHLFPVFDSDLMAAAECIYALSEPPSDFTLEIDRQAIELTKNVAKSLSQLAWDVQQGISDIHREVLEDLKPSRGTVEGIVRSLGSLVGAEEPAEAPVSWRDLVDEAGREREGSSAACSDQDRVGGVTEGGSKDVKGLLDKVVAPSTASAGLWVGWTSISSSLVKTIGTLVKADNGDEDEPISFYRKYDVPCSNGMHEAANISRLLPELSPTTLSDTAAPAVVASMPLCSEQRKEMESIAENRQESFEEAALICEHPAIDTSNTPYESEPISPPTPSEPSHTSAPAPSIPIPEQTSEPAPAPPSVQAAPPVVSLRTRPTRR